MVGRLPRAQKGPFFKKPFAMIPPPHLAVSAELIPNSRGFLVNPHMRN